MAHDNSNLTAFRVTFDDGTTLDTSMAAGVTLADATKYYVGNRFTDEDQLTGREITRTATRVEQLLTRQQAADLALRLVEGYDRTIVQPVLQDYAQGRPFRAADSHRLVILRDWISGRMGVASNEWAELVAPVTLTEPEQAGLLDLILATTSTGAKS